MNSVVHNMQNGCALLDNVVKAIYVYGIFITKQHIPYYTWTDLRWKI